MATAARRSALTPAPPPAPISAPRRRAAKIAYYRHDYRVFAAEQLKIRSSQPAIEDVSGTLDTVNAGLLPFVLDGAQRLLYAAIQQDIQRRGYCRIVTLKGRQSGWSTFFEGMLFHGASLVPNYNTLLVALDGTNTRNIFNIARLFREQMDDDIKPLVKYETKTEMTFANPNKLMAQKNPGLRSSMEFQPASNIMAGTGTTRQALHASECAKWSRESCRDLISSLLPCVHPVPGTLVCLESTAFASGDYFRALCEKARDGRSEYAWCFMPWWFNERNAIPLLKGEKIQPTLEEKQLMAFALAGQPRDHVPPYRITLVQLKWYRVNCELIDDFDQEYPKDFDSAWLCRDAHVFNQSVLAAMRATLRPALRFVEIQQTQIVTCGRGARPFCNEDYIAIFAEPERGVVYDMGVDVSAGLEGGDWSVAEIFRRDTGQQVAEYHKHIDPVDLAHEVYWLGKFYNYAQAVIEVNSYGLSTNNELTRLVYPQMYIWRHWDWHVPKLSNYTGFKTTWESKKMLVGMARHKFLHREWDVASQVLWDEMSDYIQVGEQYGAARGYDDCVVASMLALQGGRDESFGVPQSISTAPAEAPPLSPAYRDNDQPGSRFTDATLHTLAQELSAESDWS